MAPRISITCSSPIPLVATDCPEPLALSSAGGFSWLPISAAAASIGKARPVASLDSGAASGATSLACWASPVAGAAAGASAAAAAKAGVAAEVLAGSEVLHAGVGNMAEWQGAGVMGPACATRDGARLAAAALAISFPGDQAGVAGAETR